MFDLIVGLPILDLVHLVDLPIPQVWISKQMVSHCGREQIDALQTQIKQLVSCVVSFATTHESMRPAQYMQNKQKGDKRP